MNIKLLWWAMDSPRITRRQFAIGIGSCFMPSLLSFARQVETTTFSRVPLGGGGFVCDLRISADGLTRVHKTDVSMGAYIWKNPANLTATDATGTDAAFQWVPLMTETSMAGETLFVQGNYGSDFACHDAVFAPSDPTIVYMLGPGLYEAISYLFKSTDRANTFTRKAAAGRLSPQDDATRMWGPKAGVDPNNASNVIWTVSYGTDQGKLYRTTDGGDNIAAVSTFPASGAVVLRGTNHYPTAVHFDPANSGVVYAFRYGTGLYKSTDSGSNWSQVSGGPTTCRRLHVDKYGQVWICAWVDGDSGRDNVWRLDNTTWTQFTNIGDLEYANVASNPLSASKATNQVTIQHDGGLYETTYDNGATWTGFYGGGNGPIRASTDIDWLVDTDERFMTSGNIAYDTQVVSGFARGRLWSVEGIGVWYTHPPTDTSRPTFTELTRGNDELIPSAIIKPQGASRKCIVGFHDRGIFALDGVNRPATQLYDRSVSLRHNYDGLDYAGLVPDEFAASLTDSGADMQLLKSNDNGSTYTLATDPYAGTGYQPQQNMLVGVSASGFANMVVASPNNGQTIPPRYTTDGGATWNTCSYTGTAEGAVRLTGDKTTPGVFYMFVQASGFWRSTNNGATFTLVEGTTVFGGVSGVDRSLKSVPGQAGHVFLSAGRRFDYGASGLSAVHPWNAGGASDGFFMFSDDGGQNWDDLGFNWLECYGVGLGKERPGSSYPTIYVSGLKVGDTQPALYKCTDFNPSSPASATFTKINGPYGTYDAMRFVEGDMDVYGDVWVGLAASGLIRGRLQ